MAVSETYVIFQKWNKIICTLYLHISGIDNVIEGSSFSLMVVVHEWVINYKMWKVTPKPDLVAIETVRSVKNTQTIYRQHPEEIHICTARHHTHSPQGTGHQVKWETVLPMELQDLLVCMESHFVSLSSVLRFVAIELVVWSSMS